MLEIVTQYNHSFRFLAVPILYVRRTDRDVHVSFRSHVCVLITAFYVFCKSYRKGRTIAQAVSRRRPGFEPGSGNVGFVADKVALGQVFSEYFGFPCQFVFHRLFHSHHHLSSGAGAVGQTLASVPSGLMVKKKGKAIPVTGHGGP
jgi:hypothetical protein